MSVLGYRIAAAVCLLAGYCYFGNLGTIYFSNFNMGLIVIFLNYWIVFGGSICQLQAIHYSRIGSKKNIIKYILWKQCTTMTLYVTFLTLLFIGLSLLYAQPFTYGVVMRFYVCNLLNLFLLITIAILVKLQYGNTASAGLYMLVVGLNVLFGWIGSESIQFSFLMVPFAPTIGVHELVAYFPVCIIVIVLYHAYRKRDLKL